MGELHSGITPLKPFTDYINQSRPCKQLLERVTKQW